jgi:septal ring factor EnvC (AmiA/AmiB activator)
VDRMSEVVLSIVAASLATLIPALYDRIFRKKKERQAVERTSEKIDHLSNILKEAATEIEKLERNIKTKSKKIAEMDELSKRLDSLISLREKQVEAIKKELKSTLKESNRSNRIWTIIIGALWFVLGLIVRGFLGF